MCQCVVFCESEIMVLSGTSVGPGPSSDFGGVFDVSCCAPLATTFVESHVEAFSIEFERLATVLHLHKKVWALLLTAQTGVPVFSFLPVCDLLNYGEVQSSFFECT